MKVRVIESKKDNKFYSEYFLESKRGSYWAHTYRNLNSITQNEFDSYEDAYNECIWFAESKHEKPEFENEVVTSYISPRDLMLGDWVRYKTSKSPHKIFSYKELDGNLTLSFEPLPLTEEILEKNEFIKWSWYKRGQTNEIITYSIGDGFNLELKDDGSFELVDNVNDHGDYGYEANYICEIKYVHELQHIMKVLKIKKEIEV